MDVNIRSADGSSNVNRSAPEDDMGITATQQMIASCSGAMLTSLLVTPLDVVKVRLQTQQGALTKGQCFVYSNGLMDHLCTCTNGQNGVSCPWYARPVVTRFNGTFDAMLKIARAEGITSLWSGLPPTLVMAVPATICYFSMYDNLRAWLQRSFGFHMWVPVVAGASSRFAVVTLISPLEMVRTKMQSEKLSYRDMAKAVRLATCNGGVLALYRGWGPTILRDVPFSAIYWLGYENLKRLWLRRANINEPTFLMSFTSGAIAGTIAALVTLPFDVIKTHRQVAIGELQARSGVQRPTSTLVLLQRLYKDRGVRALFTGAAPRVIKIAPACAIMIGTYEYGKQFFRHQNRQQL